MEEGGPAGETWQADMGLCSRSEGPNREDNI